MLGALFALILAAVTLQPLPSVQLPAPPTPAEMPCAITESIIGFIPRYQLQVVKIAFHCNEPYRLTFTDRMGSVKKIIEISDYGTRGERTLLVPVTDWEKKTEFVSILPLYHDRPAR